MTRQAEITLQAQPLWLLPDLHTAADDAAKLLNNPTYARLCLIQQPDGRWLVCRVLADAVPPPMALRLPETPAFTTGGLLCAAST